MLLDFMNDQTHYKIHNSLENKYMSSIMEVSEDTFATEVLQSDRLTLVDFWAEWCGPCHMLSRILEDLAIEYDDLIKITKVDVEKYPDMSQKYEITSIPTSLFYMNGKQIDRLVGALGKAFFVDKIRNNL